MYFFMDAALTLFEAAWRWWVTIATTLVAMVTSDLDFLFPVEDLSLAPWRLAGDFDEVGFVFFLAFMFVQVWSILMVGYYWRICPFFRLACVVFYPFFRLACVVLLSPAQCYLFQENRKLNWWLCHGLQRSNSVDTLQCRHDFRCIGLKIANK